MKAALAPSNELNYFNFVSVVQGCAAPLLAPNDAAIQFDGNSIPPEAEELQ